MMPGMDGIELCRQLRADEQLRDTPIIMCRASTPPDPGHGALYDVFLRKPVAFQDLLAQLQRLLSQRAD
jgi:CheY-like chemotaxis protein